MSGGGLLTHLWRACDPPMAGSCPGGLVAGGLVSYTHNTQPVRQRVVFKIAGFVHQSLVGLAPAFLADDCRLLSDVGRRPLRSNSNDMRKLLGKYGNGF